jgi:hypothetical protein
MPKPLSEQLAELSVRAKHAEDAVAAAKKEARDKVVARKEQARGARRAICPEIFSLAESEPHRCTAGTARFCAGETCGAAHEGTAA